MEVFQNKNNFFLHIMKLCLRDPLEIIAQTLESSTTQCWAEKSIIHCFVDICLLLMPALATLYVDMGTGTVSLKKLHSLMTRQFSFSKVSCIPQFRRKATFFLFMLVS